MGAQSAMLGSGDPVHHGNGRRRDGILDTVPARSLFLGNRDKPQRTSTTHWSPQDHHQSRTRSVRACRCPGASNELRMLFEQRKLGRCFNECQMGREWLGAVLSWDCCLAQPKNDLAAQVWTSAAAVSTVGRINDRTANRYRWPGG